MAKTLNARIITKHDTAENWNKAEGFIPKLGEIIIVDTPEDNIYSQYKVDSIPRLRIGDGKTKCKDLHYITDTYVAKEPGKKLSSNDYSDLHYNIVDEIANLGYQPVYTDTKYNAGYGLGIKNNSFYSTGVVDINNSNKNGTFKCAIGIGPNGEYEEKEITIPGLTETAFTPISNFLTSSSIANINKAITTIEPSTEPGTLNYTNAIGETSSVAIPGLGKLAFKDGFDGDFMEVVEVAVSYRQPMDNIPIWINNETNTLKFYDIASKTYKDIQAGVQKIEKINSSTLKIDTNGNTENISIAPEFSVSEGTTNGTIQIVLNGTSYTGKVKGLQANAYSADSFLKLAGGTLTGQLSGTSFWANQSSGENQSGVTYNGGSLYFWGNNNTGTAGIYDSNGGYVIQRDASNGKYNINGNKVYGAVYNDYAEYRQSIKHIEPGYIVYSDDDGILRKTKNRLQHFEGVVSDTFGFSIGKTDKAQTPLAVAGRVLVYTDEELHAGDVVCAGENGKASKMDNIEIANKPDRIVGIVSEIPTYNTWGEDNIPVNGRVWIRVK